jgi:hypothetical protein
MKGFVCAFAMGIYHNEKKVNVFKVKDLKMHDNGIQFQK